MKYLYYILLFICSPLFVKAQSNYKPGYIVNLNGDTTKGYVNYREWEKSPDHFAFKDNLNNESTEYNFDNVSAFGIDRMEHYRRKTVWLSQDATGPVKPVGLDTTEIRKTVFLRVVTDGAKLRLYQYTDIIKTRYYIEEVITGEPKELVYHSYLDIDHSTLITSTHYRAQLMQLAGKYAITNKTIQNKILKARYAAADLNDVILQINGNKPEKTFNATNAGVRLFGGLAFNYAKLNISGYRDFTDNRTIIKNTPFPKLQAGIDFFANEFTKRLVFRAEVSYTQNKHEISVPVERLANTTGTADLNYTQKVLAITPQILFAVYNTETIKVYLQGGVSFNFMSYGTYGYKVTYNDPYYNYELKQEPGFATSQVSFVGKLSVSFKRFELFAGMSPKTVYTNVLNYSFSNQVYQTGFNWYITK